MKRNTIAKAITPLLSLLTALQPSVSAAELRRLTPGSHASPATALQHVYVVGANPSARATIGKALTRLGYTDGGESPVTDREGYSYTDVATREDDVEWLSAAGVSSPDSSWIVARRDRNQTAATSARELAVQGGLVRGVEGLALHWPGRMVGALGEEVELLELRIDAAGARGTQAQKWVALCEFLGLGYSTVERLKLWQFP